MNISENKYDAIDELIYNEGLKIQTLEVHPQKDFMLIFLTNQQVLKIRLSLYNNLEKADLKSLQRYHFIADRTGIHWPDLDEDLSLKGFLKEFLKQKLKTEKQLDIG